jgi:putative drug exporter of the RND superfamily
VLDRIARLTWRRPKLVLALVGVFVAVAGTFGYDVEQHLQAAGFTDSASESERATAFLHDELGYDATPAIVVLIRNPEGGKLDVAKPSVRREVARISRALRQTRHVGHVVNPLSGRAEGRALIERNGRSLVVSANLTTLDIERDGGPATVDARRRIGDSTLDVALGGFAVSFEEVNDQTRSDLAKAELIAFPILAILLLLVFRGVVAAAIPLLLGVVSILGTFLMLRLMSGAVGTSLFALNIATALSLGLAVDYGLLMVSRYREELERAGGPTQAAHRRMVQTAGRTVLFSGFTVASAMAALMVMPQRFLYSVGAAGAAVGILSAVIAVLAVPALAALLGTRINALATRRGPAVSAHSSGWYRLAKAVMRRPALTALGCTALLLALASPLVGTRLTGPSEEAVPPSQPSYAVNTYIEQHYSEGVTFPITVTVRGDASPARLALLHRRLVQVDGLAGGTRFARVSPRAAVASFAPAGKALDPRVQDAVHRIREHHVPGGGAILVSGNTARFIDEKQSLAEGLPLVAAIICATTLLLLFALTGSIILPIKTLVMNALTLAASLGVVVLAFQHGWLDGAFAYRGPSAVEVTSLAFLVVVAFGLATDYAVLVLARIKEQHDLGASNEEAVARGLGATGHVITAAAVAIAVVFLAFGVSAVFFMKQIALGEAVAVLIDATIVRALLVPALMALLGRWNWWAPRPLARLQARYGFSEA